MNIYINASGSVSPNSHPLAAGATANAMRCADPDLSAIIDPKLSRRMSHVIKMGMAAAFDALKKAGDIKPDAIITGTAYGCLEDTGIFLKKQVQQQESMLTPTAFIQSTHNTVGGQIGLMLQCNGYNNTVVHRGFSFEQALQDAMLLLLENNAEQVLVGAADEITTVSHSLLSRFNLYKKETAGNGLSNNGTIAGEGANYFVLSNQASGKNIAMLKALHCFYKPRSIEGVITEIKNFMQKNMAGNETIDAIMIGKNGDEMTDKNYDGVLEAIHASTIYSFKHDCGEYPTASAFGLHRAIEILKTSQDVKNVLIYNHYENIHHSLQLVTAC